MSLIESGILLVAAGAALGYLWRGVSKLFTYAKTKLVYYIHCTNDNAMFYHIEAWMDQTEYIKTCKNLSIKYYCDRHIKTLGYGLHMFKHKGVRMVVYKHREDNKEASWHVKETFTAVVLTKKLDYIEAWLKEVEEAHDKQPYKNTKVFLNKLDNAIEKPIVSREPTLDGTIYKDLIKDLEHFMRNEDYYVNLGIPYKRGYLLYGPPGNGKTTTILCLAQRYQKHVRLLNLSQMSNDELVAAIATLSKNTILVLEDIDCVKASSERSVENEAKKNESGPPKAEGVTLNVLLNCLDGLLTKHGMITFATTNHLEKLDAALVRAGRMDKKIEFQNATKAQAINYFNKFFPDMDGSQFAEQFDGKPMCELEQAVLELLNERTSQQLHSV